MTSPYIVRKYHHIHGENFYIPDDERETQLEVAVHLGALRVKQRACSHEPGPWQTYDRLTERRCKKCGKVEYK